MVKAVVNHIDEYRLFVFYSCLILVIAFKSVAIPKAQFKNGDSCIVWSVEQWLLTYEYCGGNMTRKSY